MVSNGFLLQIALKFVGPLLAPSIFPHAKLMRKQRPDVRRPVARPLAPAGCWRRSVWDEEKVGGTVIVWVYGCILKDLSFIWLMVPICSNSLCNKKKVIIHMFRISKLPEIPAILAGQLERKTKKGTSWSSNPSEKYEKPWGWSCHFLETCFHALKNSIQMVLVFQILLDSVLGTNRLVFERTNRKYLRCPLEKNNIDGPIKYHF